MEPEVPRGGGMTWGVRCKSCDKFCLLPRGTVADSEQTDERPGPGAVAEVLCPNCGGTHSYTPEEVVMIRT